VIYQLVRFYILLKINNLQKGFLRGNEAKIRADWPGFIGDFRDFEAGNEAPEFARNVYRQIINI
jgi:hypothetical protein